jgi:hypothetical protein
MSTPPRFDADRSSSLASIVPSFASYLFRNRSTLASARARHAAPPSSGASLFVIRTRCNSLPRAGAASIAIALTIVAYSSVRARVRVSLRVARASRRQIRASRGHSRGRISTSPRRARRRARRTATVARARRV